MAFVIQLVKMAALAALIALALTYWLSDRSAGLGGLIAFYLLLVRVS